MDYSDPLSRKPPELPFCQAIQPGRLPLPHKVAWSPDLGIAPVDAEVVSICKQAAGWFGSVGGELVHDCPDLHDAAPIFQVRLPACLHSGVKVGRGERSGGRQGGRCVCRAGSGSGAGIYVGGGGIGLRRAGVLCWWGMIWDGEGACMHAYLCVAVGVGFVCE